MHVIDNISLQLILMVEGAIVVMIVRGWKFLKSDARGVMFLAQVREGATNVLTHMLLSFQHSPEPFHKVSDINHLMVIYYM
jgi:hypothetical protein